MTATDRAQVNLVGLASAGNGEGMVRNKESSSKGVGGFWYLGVYGVEEWLRSG